MGEKRKGIKMYKLQLGWLLIPQICPNFPALLTAAHTVLTTGNTSSPLSNTLRKTSCTSRLFYHQSFHKVSPNTPSTFYLSSSISHIPPCTRVLHTSDSPTLCSQWAETIYFSTLVTCSAVPGWVSPKHLLNQIKR